ncbi:hypothetical protein [Spongiivirga citrea]|uniref:Tetratricopeptide repeat protein n=1 Tax=Spongiivirga citrea TaxID=1481457 RepID=A0A6M0CS95_9FLAO|nr:hypothetical protein [Spongiivirga citrea]NER18789.1 hypothetical protein [Spongiivirga citrea]
MNISDFTYLLKEPDAINEDQTEAIESIIKQYPYFQAARAIFLKGLKNQESFRYNDQLKVTAAHSADRTVLFDFITSDAFKKPVISASLKEKDPMQIEVQAFEEVASEYTELSAEDKVVDKTISESTRITEKTVESQPEIEEEIVEVSKEIPTSKPETDVLEIDKPLEFDKNERFSFNQWLQLSSVKPIVREAAKSTEKEIEEPTRKIEETKTKVSAEEEKTPSSKSPSFEEKMALIDRFIENNPKIKPAKETIPMENLAEGNLVDRNELATETLAKVYLAQKKYKKAIQAYKILSLKYPEKNSFFADRIQEIKNIKKNN